MLLDHFPHSLDSVDEVQVYTHSGLLNTWMTLFGMINVPFSILLCCIGIYVFQKLLRKHVSYISCCTLTAGFSITVTQQLGLEGVQF